MVMHGGGDTQAEDRFYTMTLVDFSGDSFSNVGSRVLGDGGALLQSTDIYVKIQSRAMNFTVDDSGTTDHLYAIHAQGFNDFSTDNTGSSTLTTDGHILNTDTFHYNESSGNVASTSESHADSGSTWVATGDSTDSYNNDDTGFITRSDADVTSASTFTMDNARTVNGEINETETDGMGNSTSFHDVGYENDSMHAEGTRGNDASYDFESRTTLGNAYEITASQAGSFSYTEAGANLNTQLNSGWTASGPGVPATRTP